MLKIALTGGIASGKSLASRLFEEAGAPVIDTDILARELVQPGKPALTRIVERFGASILQPDGSLDRRQLRTRIFSHPGERQALEDILHPAIQQELFTRLDSLDSPYAILVIPLLTESPRDWGQDRVLLVDAPEAMQKSRLMQRDGCTESEARAALASQAGRTQRQAIADDIILNDGGPEKLEKAVRRLHDYYTELASTQ